MVHVDQTLKGSSKANQLLLRVGWDMDGWGG